MESRENQPLTVAARCWIAAAIAFVAGLSGWVWTGEWRWAATGLLATLLALAFATVVFDGKPRG